LKFAAARMGSGVSDLTIVDEDPVLRAGIDAARRRVATPITTEQPPR
jgi:hypothetical protein